MIKLVDYLTPIMQKAVGLLIAIFLTNLAGMYFGFYEYWWFDMSLHFLGGFFVAMLMAHYLADIIETRNPLCQSHSEASKKQETGIKKYLVMVGAVTFIGVVWEFAEYLASQTLIEPLYNNFGFRTYFIGDLDDTINDLLMDIVGALAFIFTRRR